MIDYKGSTTMLQVFDMPTSLAFYRDVLGFELVSNSPELGKDFYNWVLLRSNGIELMLNTRYEEDSRPAHPPAEAASVHDDTCLYFAVEDVNGAYKYLVSKGVKLNPPKVAPYGMRQLYLHDPDGFSICFQWPAE